MSKLPNIHPGEVLLEEFLIPLGISQYRLAKAIGVPQPRIGGICAGRRSITADTALRLAKALGTSPRFWLGLQADYDTEEALSKHSEALDHIHALTAPHQEDTTV
ncbi:MAG: HigA family addiction module antidote protein [Azoarcus sp.]|nr:HigA family addiction module antidote protein [Azoarcus sp.]